MSLSTRQVKAHFKLPAEDDAMVAGWVWRFTNGCHKEKKNGGLLLNKDNGNK